MKYKEGKGTSNDECIHDTENPEEYEPPSENTDTGGNGTGNVDEWVYGGCGSNIEKYAYTIFLGIFFYLIFD